MDTKYCPRCKETKPHSEFGKNKSRKDGIQQYCKVCHRERLQEYRKKPEWLEWRRKRYQEKIEDEREKSREYYWQNREERIEKVAEYRADNKEAHNNRSKQWYENNREKAKAIKKKRYWDNVEAERETSRLYAEKNKEKRAIVQAEYRKNNPEKRKAHEAKRSALEKSAEGEFSPTEWKELCQKYDYTCLCCGKKEPEIKLSPDHVIPLSRGGTNYISNIQPLCGHCNRKKMTKTTDFRTKGH